VKAFAIYIRYISLLLCGGLILTLYINEWVQQSSTEKNVAEKTEVINKTQAFSFFYDVMVPFIPALKS
jgi:hypothetical protein